jgi:hypothetical protein
MHVIRIYVRVHAYDAYIHASSMKAGMQKLRVFVCVRGM